MTLAEPYCPDEGDVINLDFDPQAGNEQAGRRPAVVLTPRAYNSKAGLAVVCPITNSAKGYPFEVAFPPETKKVTGVVLADHMKSLSWKARNAQFRCEAPDEVMVEIKAKIAPLLGL